MKTTSPQSVALTGLIAAALLAGGPAIAADENDPLTHGMVQMTVQVGVTTQAEILEKFGAPNITTLDGNGNEMWVYDRHATVTSNSASGFSIGMAGGGLGGAAAGGAGLGFGKSKAKSAESTRSMTLIIKFDSQRRVSDFRSRSSSF